MNERIKQFAIDVIVENTASEAWVFTDKELDKFAELIVRECANVVAEYYDPNEPWITPKTLLYHF